MTNLTSRLGVSTLPYAPSLLIDIARAAERNRYARVGLADSPILYGEIYPCITAVLAATSQIQVGPNVTNPVSRHWTIHAASARSLDALYPGRLFLGLAAGDGAVHTVGLRPASREELISAARNIRENAPSTVDIHMAASGPKAARAIGSVADTAIIATGSDSVALAKLGACAREGRSTELPLWGLVYVDVVSPGASVGTALERALPIAMSMSRFCLADTFEDKNVPTDYQIRFREAMSRYDFMHHASGGDNPNVGLLADSPEVRDYIRDRFCIVGTAAQCAERLATMLAEGGLDGVWMAMNSTDPVGNLERLAAVG